MLAPHYPTTCLAAAFEYFRRGDEQALALKLNSTAPSPLAHLERMVIDLLAVELDDAPRTGAPFRRRGPEPV